MQELTDESTSLLSAGIYEEYGRLHRLNNMLETEILSLRDRFNAAMGFDGPFGIPTCPETSQASGQISPFAGHSFDFPVWGPRWGKVQPVAPPKEQDSASSKSIVALGEEVVHSDSVMVADMGKKIVISEDNLNSKVSFEEHMNAKGSLEGKSLRNISRAGSCNASPARAVPEVKPLKPAVSIAFETGDEKAEKPREERVRKLQHFFDRLNVDGGPGISDVQLQGIMERVHAGRNPLTLDSIRMLIKRMDAINRKHADLNEEGGFYDDGDGAATSPSSSVAKILRFPTFADIILFDRMKGVDGGMYRNVAILRDAIMRLHLDELVSTHARLPPALSERDDTTMGRASRLAKLMEPLVAIVILVNGLTIGLSSDIDWDGWETLEIFFTAFFLLEIGVKITATGVEEHFIGPDWRWNWFDAVVVGFAVVDVALSQFLSQLETSDLNLKDVTLIRFARLARLSRLMRLIRVLRFRIFRELTQMLKGVVAGLNTLFWAIVMLLFIVYGCSVFLRQTVGMQGHRMKDKYDTVLFGTLGWSMFSVFRCFMSDCTLADGTPIAVHLFELYDFLFVVPYSFGLLFVVFGVFNMVTGVFVERVMDAAKKRERQHEEAEQIRLGEKISELVRILSSTPHEDEADRCTFSAGASETRSQSVFRMSQSTNNWVRVDNFHNEITRESFTHSLRNPRVTKLIDDLEIQVGDRAELFEVLDSDGSGSIDIGELITGIMKMRSAETKQDVVALILLMRGLRSHLQMMAKLVEEGNENLSFIRQHCETK